MSTTTQPTTSSGDGDDEVVMDGSLWGQLQRFIDLSIIYAKLPLAPFFRLRQVCQRWNRLASDRHFLLQSFQRIPIANPPFFIVAHKQFGHRLLTKYHASGSRPRWSFSPLPRARCEVSGLLFEHSDSVNRVFDVHTRVFHSLPLPVVQVPLLPVEEEDDYEDPLIGMIVDTSVKPYDFRVILADDVIGTKIFDSKSGAWAHKPSTYVYSAPVEGPQSCVHHDGIFYIRVGADLHRYDLERDEWDCLDYSLPNCLLELSNIGVWRGRLFGLFVAELFSGVTYYKVLTVWELSNHSEEPWVEYMPPDLFLWILNGEEEKHGNLESKFCGEYVLVYNCVVVTDRAVLFNLDRKTWEKVELPAM